MLTTALLGGCASGQDPISRMDQFFDRIDPPAPPADAVTTSPIITGPGYAPAYPPYRP
ncbi:MAG: hypothetical protein JSS43_13115 [Proteobacteria bacterium]|nr:hypothetical protein [Pseudomonadota bacterium]